MKDDFTTILSELSQAMSTTVEKLTSQGSFDSYTQGRINNVNKRMKALESSAKEILENYSDRRELLINFKKRASEIMEEVKELN